MRLQPVALAPLTIGFLLSVLVLILAVIGAAGVLPMNAVTVFGLIAVLALARMC
jgi:hypothetical protein